MMKHIMHLFGIQIYLDLESIEINILLNLISRYWT